MNLNEARVGNLGSYEGEVRQVMPTSFSNGMVEAMQPIHLTEEWFLRLGFDSQYNGQEFSKSLKYGFLKIRMSKNGLHPFSIGSEEGCNSIANVHQLQNLFHSLTGQELEIK